MNASEKMLNPYCVAISGQRARKTQPHTLDFCCFNIYLHDVDRLGAYFDRLQHIAGDRPLVLGEFGSDSFRQGAHRQAELLANHVGTVFRHGLAGSIVFSFTDDWFTRARRLLPVPGSPTRSVTLPSGIFSGQSHSTFCAGQLPAHTRRTS